VVERLASRGQAFGSRDVTKPLLRSLIKELCLQSSKQQDAADAENAPLDIFTALALQYRENDDGNDEVAAGDRSIDRSTGVCRG
jgi:hypothetical protein